MCHRWSSLFAGRISHLIHKPVNMLATTCYAPVCLDFVLLHSTLIKLLYGGTVYWCLIMYKVPLHDELTLFVSGDNILLM